MKNSGYFATRTQEEADETDAILLAESDTEKLRTEASSTAKKTEKEEERKKTTSSCRCKIKKDKAEESWQKNKRTIPKEVSGVEKRIVTRT